LWAIPDELFDDPVGSAVGCSDPAPSAPSQSSYACPRSAIASFVPPRVNASFAVAVNSTVLHHNRHSEPK